LPIMRVSCVRSITALPEAFSLDDFKPLDRHRLEIGIAQPQPVQCFSQRVYQDHFAIADVALDLRVVLVHLTNLRLGHHKDPVLSGVHPRLSCAFEQS
jgi:hypothetical protein